jgi:hypothetical protein
MAPIPSTALPKAGRGGPFFMSKHNMVCFRDKALIIAFMIATTPASKPFTDDDDDTCKYI